MSAVPKGPFYTAAMKRWLGGYEPVLAKQHAKVNYSANATAARERDRAKGKPWAVGTVEGLKRDQAAQDKRAKVRRGGL